MLIKGCWTWVMSGLKNHRVSEEVFGEFLEVYFIDIS